MSKVKLVVYEHQDGVDFKIKNINDLTHKTIEKLRVFATKRGGYFRQDLARFDIKRRLSQKDVLQIFELLEIDIEIVIDDEDNAKDYPASQRIVEIGKYKGFKWCDVPLTYLKWMYKETENNFAYAEIKRRRNAPRDIQNEVIKFGKHKGKRWINLPVDYLEWVINQFSDDKEEYKLAKQTLNKKHNI